MNSITKNITAGSIISTLKMARSGRKTDVILVVEGDDDIALFSSAFQLSNDRFISCNGKERLMEVYNCIPHADLDDGMLFVRDADFDKIVCQVVHGIQLLVSDRYDFEMMIIGERLFDRVFSEYMRRRANETNREKTLTSLLFATAAIGALKKYSLMNNLGLKFDGAEAKFFCVRTLTVDLRAMIRLYFARSHTPLRDMESVISFVQEEMGKAADKADLSSGKDFIQLLSMSLSRHFKVCSVAECSELVLARMFRVAVILDDFRTTNFLACLKKFLSRTTFSWAGIAI